MGSPSMDYLALAATVAVLAAGMGLAWLLARREKESAAPRGNGRPS